MSTKKTTKTIDLNRFSYFSAPITNNHPKCEISLDMVHSVITSNHFNEATKQLRFSNDKSEQAELKKTKLDYVTFSGVFKKRANDSLTNHSGLICLDIDDLKSVKRTKEKIIDTQPPSLLFTSPLGNELQNLILKGDSLSISDGNTVKIDFPAILDNDSTNELQSITLANDTITLSKGGGKIPLSDIKSYVTKSSGGSSSSTSETSGNLCFKGITADLSDWAAPYVR